MIQRPKRISDGRVFDPLSLSVTLPVDSMPTAQMALRPGDEIGMHDTVEIWTAQGSAGLFRVISRAVTYGDQVTVNLAGAADFLTDDVYPSSQDIKGDIATVIVGILAVQTTQRWQLGTCAPTGNIKIGCSMTDLWSLLESVRSQRKGYVWTFDYSTTPWTMNLVAMPDTVAAELRIGRNLDSVTIDVSDAEMCTKLYMTVTNPTTGASTLGVYDNLQAQAKYGVIVKTADVSTEDAPVPADYAAAILAERAEPVAYITISGEDLHSITGDDFDKITMGSQCRVILPGFDPLTETVKTLTWPNALDEPERVNVSMANNLKPFSETLSTMRRTGASNASRIGKNEESITLKVDKGDVSTQLAIECGNVTITGGDLVVNGMITATDLAAGTISAIDIGTGTMSGGQADFTTILGTNIQGSHILIEDSGGEDLIGAIKNVRVIPITGTDSYKLQYSCFGTYGTDNWVDAGTFNRAASTITLSGVWSGGYKFTVTPSPQSAGSPLVEDLSYSISPTPSGGASSTTIDNFNAYNKASVTIGATSIPSGYLKQFVIDADSVFLDGYDNCKAIVDITSATVDSVSASGGTVSIDVEVGIGDAMSTWRTATATATTTITQGSPVWGAVTSGNSNTFTVTDSAGASTSQSVYLSQDTTWSSGTKNVYLTKINSSTSNQIAITSVNIPEITNGSAWSGSSQQQTADQTFSLGAGYDWYTLTVDCGGRTKKLQVHILRS